MDPSILLKLFDQFGPAALSILSGVDNSVQTGLSNLFNYFQGQQNEGDYRQMAGSQLPIYENLVNGATGTLNRNAQGAIDREFQYARDASNMGAETRDRALQNFSGLQRDVLNEASGNLDRNLQGYRDRYQRGMDYLRGAGAQERRDINQQFDNQNSATTQQLVNSGFGNSSIGPTIRRGIERGRADSLGGLNERIRNQYLATDAGLSGDLLNADERMSGALNSLRFNTGSQGINLDMGLSGGLQDTIQRLMSGANRFGYGATGDTIGNTFNLSTVPLNAQERFTNTGIGLRNDTQYQPPPPFNPTLAFSAGGSTVGAPNYPSPSYLSSFLNPFSAGVGAAAGGAATSGLGSLFAGGGGTGAYAGLSKLAVGCIDAEALIDTPSGAVKLEDIRVGDMVTGLDGKPHRVMFKDCGEPHSSRGEDYIAIEFSDERTLTLTSDHELGARNDSDEFETRSGQLVSVRSTHPVAAVRSGDLWLFGSGGYWANGIPVKSMLKRHGFSLTDLRRQEVA